MSTEPRYAAADAQADEATGVAEDSAGKLEVEKGRGDGGGRLGEIADQQILGNRGRADEREEACFERTGRLCRRRGLCR